MEVKSSSHSNRFKRQTFHSVLLYWKLTQELLRPIRRSLKLNRLHQRRKAIQKLAAPEHRPKSQPKVLVYIAHIVSSEEAKNQEKACAKIERLKHTIDGLLSSFAHCDLKIIIATVPGRSITHYLPKYQIQHIQVQEELDCDPMFVGFRIQENLVNQVESFDWFIFIEDDIVINDAFFIEKLENFNQSCGYEDAVLLPHRYEIDKGIKQYIDLTIDTELAWNKLSIVNISGIKFAEYTNPHAGMYCLSQTQLRRWIKSGRSWRNQELIVGPLESAVTFCLLECFALYKPHPDNLRFLEVRHYDTKYSQLNPETSPYRLSGVV